MFEGFLEKFLLKYFGEYLKGIDKSNLSVAVWKGEITVKTVDINPDIMKKFNLPLKIIFGKIDSLLLRVPWNNLSSKPVELNIENISLVVSVQDNSSWYAEKQYIEFCQALVGDIKDEMAKKLEEEFEKQEKKSSFFEQIFDNLVINVKNINLRIESNLGQKYCFGLVLEDFNIRSVDKAGRPVFIKRVSGLDAVTKMISFKNLVLYHEKEIISHLKYNEIDTYFKNCRIDNFHKIINLNLDLLFTLAPFDRTTSLPKSQKPIYLLETEINSVEVVFSTDTIRDMVDLLEYCDLHIKSQLE